MLKFDTEIYLDPSLSKKVLESIRDQKKIDYKTLKIFYLRKRIQNLEKKFQLKLNNNLKLNYKNYLFWQLVKEEYNLENLDIKKKKIGNKKNEVNVNFTYFIKFLGFNPSLLSLLIFSKEIKKIVKLNNFFETLQNKIDLENINTSERIKFINLLEKREINIVTPLCPDYEHVKVGNNLFKYTFKKLGSGIGMMGTRFLSIYSDLLSLFLKEKVTKFGFALIFLSFATIVYSLDPSGSFNTYVIIFPFITAVAFAMYQLFTKIVAKDKEAFVALFYTSAIGSVIFSILAYLYWTPIESNKAWLILIFLGFIGFLSHYLFAVALQTFNLYHVTNFQYTQLIWASLINYFIFGDTVSDKKIIGIIFIIIFGLIFINRELKYNYAK